MNTTPPCQLWLLQLIIACSAFGVMASPVLAQEDEVWQMEEAYWRYGTAGDLENYLALWHDEVMGWGCNLPHPFGKAYVSEWVKAVRDGTLSMTYELHREAVRVFGDVAIVHYSAAMKQRSRDGPEEPWVTKLTHTWLRVDGEWKIIGGMCAELGPAAPETN